jgi:hypothetical protein
LPKFEGKIKRKLKCNLAYNDESKYISNVQNHFHTLLNCR